jgi:hypothetical protein
MAYAPLIIAAFAMAGASACFLYMQVSGRSPPRQAIVGSVAGTIVGLVALGVALVY